MTEKEMYALIQTYRANEPILWAFLAGKRTVPTIAEHLLMTPTEVKVEVKALLDAGILEEGVYMTHVILKASDPSLKQLTQFAWKFRKRLTRREK